MLGVAEFSGLSSVQKTKQESPNLHSFLAVVRARRWFKMLVEQRVGSIADLARLESVNRSWISQQIGLAFLAPDIVCSVLGGSQPASLTLDRLIEIASLPGWSDQSTAFSKII